MLADVSVIKPVSSSSTKKQKNKKVSRVRPTKKVIPQSEGKKPFNDHLESQYKGKRLNSYI